MTRPDARPGSQGACGPCSAGSDISRRAFLALSGTGILWLAAPALALRERAPAAEAPLALAEARPASLAVPGSCTLGIERQLDCFTGYAMAWRCPLSGAELHWHPHHGIRLLEPGWGWRDYPLAAFREGHPQQAVRRLFGERVVEELVIHVDTRA